MRGILIAYLVSKNNQHIRQLANNIKQLIDIHRERYTALKEYYVKEDDNKKKLEQMIRFSQKNYDKIIFYKFADHQKINNNQQFLELVVSTINSLKEIHKSKSLLSTLDKIKLCQICRKCHNSQNGFLMLNTIIHSRYPKYELLLKEIKKTINKEISNNITIGNNKKSNNNAIEMTSLNTFIQNTQSFSERINNNMSTSRGGGQKSRMSKKSKKKSKKTRMSKKSRKIKSQK